MVLAATLAAACGAGSGSDAPDGASGTDDPPSSAVAETDPDATGGDSAGDSDSADGSDATSESAADAELDEESATEPPARTEVSGSALPTFEATENDPAVGAAVPTVTGTDLLTGAPVRIEVSDRPLVVAFYAHWCPHCQAEVEALTDWLKTNELPDSVDFVAVSVLEDATRGNHPPAKWLSEQDWQYPVVADTADLDVANAFGLSSVPFLVAAHADGSVALRYGGNLGPDQLLGLFEFLATSG